jgi:hypothetical protein
MLSLDKCALVFLIIGIMQKIRFFLIYSQPWMETLTTPGTPILFLHPEQKDA